MEPRPGWPLFLQNNLSASNDRIDFSEAGLSKSYAILQIGS